MQEIMNRRNFYFDMQSIVEKHESVPGCSEMAELIKLILWGVHAGMTEELAQKVDELKPEIEKRATRWLNYN